MRSRTLAGLVAPIYFALWLIYLVILLILCPVLLTYTCVSSTSVFDLYITFLFWPYVSTIDYIVHPFWYATHGGQVLYLGCIDSAGACPKLETTSNLKNSFTHQSDLPVTPKGFLRFVCVSDTHTKHVWLDIPEGDVLLHAGDVSFQNRGERCSGARDFTAINQWFGSLPHVSKCIIAGNHDGHCAVLQDSEVQELVPHASYLCNSATLVSNTKHTKSDSKHATRACTQETTEPTYQGGSDPVTIQSPLFPGPESSLSGCAVVWGTPLAQMGGSGNVAFQRVHKELTLELRAKPLPPRVDVLLCHSGSSKGMRAFIREVGPRVVVCGHFHARYGAQILKDTVVSTSADDKRKQQQTVYINASSLDGNYSPRHAPVVFDLEIC